jgi:predicted oxidoreductase (fatty acid repression mutant protein)
VAQEDRKVVQEFQNKFAIYAEKFPLWVRPAPRFPAPVARSDVVRIV